MKKLKSALIIWISIYPAITIILQLFGEQLNQVPLIQRTFILTVILVPMMVYLLVPFWTYIVNKMEARLKSSTN